MERKRSLREKRENILGYSMALAPLIGFALFTLGPLIISVFMSLSTFENNAFSFAKMQLSGFGNYVRLFTDERIHLWRAVKNTLLLCLSVPLEILFSLAGAWLLKTKVKGKKFFRVVLFMPSICSVIAIAYTWRYFFSEQEWGLFNQLLKGIGVSPIGWLTDEKLFIPCVIIMNIWTVTGYGMLLLQAALENINQSLYEAAALDGASSLRTLVSVTIPLITPTIFFLFMTSLIGALQNFVKIDAMNLDPYFYGPNDAGLTLVAVIVRAKDSPNMYGGLGVSAAASLFTGVIIGLVTIANYVISKKWVYYNED